MGPFDGLGSELGILNLALYMIGLGGVSIMASKIKLWIKTDWEKFITQHRKMWKEYAKSHRDDTGSYD